MSFSITTGQIKSGTKDVTRRSGWLFLKPGDLVRPVRKARGLRPGEKIEPLRAPIRIVSVRREPLRTMLDDLEYGYEEVRREGYEGHPEYGHPSAWVQMFCLSHKGTTPDSLVTRIEFEYTDASGQPGKRRRSDPALP